MSWDGGPWQIPAELSPIFSVSLRELPRVLRKKGNKTKTRNKTGTVQKTRKTSAEFPHFLRGKHVLISELINARGTITSGKSAVYMSRSDNDMYVFLKIF